MAMAEDRPTLYAQRGGTGAPLLLLLHGLGANASVWDGLLPILAHSMGGVVGAALATQWFGVRVRAVAAFAVKPDFDPGDVERLRSVGSKGYRWFDTRAEAIERQIAVAGLRGLIEPGDPRAAIGVTEANGKFRIATDPRANLVLGPDLGEFLRAAHVPIHFAAGDRDQLVSVELMRGVDPEAHVFPGRGHNVQVEDPLAVWEYAEAVFAGIVPG